MKTLQLIKKTKLENSLNTLVLIGKMHAYHRKSNKRSVRTASQQQVRQKVIREVLKHGKSMSHILMVHLIAYLLHKNAKHLLSN